ncbi:bifunctional (p)ppGpp synthetase/guanosine-3',5'-bis(diphosphate) 3'-pyrophosphohydrolase [Candidatus Woesearchaeota archaeon]|nr:bifunctional (p)ppGpp synthetase/guanosine-3',5'-bis(diphosphate) 3'-pyrophosphohydrolase [Candidatus Woesearchaeota archaeon]
MGSEKEDFLAICKDKGYSAKDISLFESALVFAEEKFGDKMRISGGFWHFHNFNVGKILAEMGSGPEAVLAGILHSLEKHKDEIEKGFGKDVFSIIKGVSEIKEIKSKNPSLQAEAIKKILMTTIADIRVIVVKLANEIDNFRNIENLSKAEQDRIAEEALEVYAPLAYRLGNERVRVRLENSAFKILNPKKYSEIDRFLKASSEERERYVHDAIELVSGFLRGKVSVLNIKGRPKHIYSIYRKMIKKNISLDRQRDLLGIRILVPETKDCYSVLGILHEKLEPLEGRIKDYIANPKPNFYRSIHTVVKLPNGKIVEVQIRTKEMDEFAEEGLAAHWKYKGIRSDDSFEKRVGWLKGVLALQKSEGNQEFLEATKVDVFGDKIYCYTPKGDVKELPAEASVLDFAFTVHEQVGYKAIAGRVNGKFVPLKHSLVKGDVVEIITNKNQRPHRNWIKWVRSANSRQKIRKALKEHDNLPAIHYRIPKVKVAEGEKAYLVESKEFTNAACVLAKCCNPIPGDDIVGIATKKRVISVHGPECKQAAKEEKRWLKVFWKESFNQKIRFFISAKERSGLLADLLHTIASAGFEVKEAKAKLTGPNDMECSFMVIPRSLEHLKDLIKRVLKLKSVRRVFFES